MTDERDFGPQDELSPAEQAAFDALPREQAPPAFLEDRAVAMLRRTGHLPTPLSVGKAGTQLITPSGSWQVGKVKRAVWMTGLAAAAITIFASGLAVGQYMGINKVGRIVGDENRTASQAAHNVRVTGDRYIAALASLGQLRDTSDVDGKARAKETALAVLGAAAQEIANLAPDDPLAAAVLRGLNERSRQSGSNASSSRSVIWY